MKNKKKKGATITEDNHELIWFFNEAEAALGAHSTFSAFLYYVQRGTKPSGNEYSDPESDITDARIDAATKYRNILRKINRLDKRKQLILELAFTYTRRHPQLNLAFDDALPALLIDYTPEQLLSFIVGKKKEEAKELKLKARKEIEQCLISYQNLS